MSISTLEDYAAALKQRVQFTKVTVSAGGGFVNSTSKGSTGLPPVFSAVANATTGVVPVAGDTGFPSLQPWSGDGHITSVEYTNMLAAVRGFVYDRLFHAGPIPMGATTTLGSQPSYSGRVPGGTDYKGLQIWLEGHSVSGTPTITVTYTDQDGNPGHSTPSVAFGANQLQNYVLYNMPLASGDTGVQVIESVIVSGGTSGTFNVVVMRRLFNMYPQLAATPRVQPLEELGMPIVYTTSAIAVATYSSTGNTGTLDISIEVASN